MVDETKSEEMTMDDLDQLINNNPPDGATPPAAEDDTPSSDATDTTGSEGTDDNSDAAAEGGNDANQNESNPADSKHDSNQAFAAMRVQNKKMQAALQAVLQQHGLDPALAGNPDQLIQDAEDARLEQEAKNQKVPAELLKRLTQLERTNLENQQRRLSDAALAGFQQVKDKYNLSTQELSEFAKQLQDAGENPFERELDIEKLYRMHNTDKIIAAEVNKAVEAALKNQNAAFQHSSTPSKNQGKDSSGVEQIDTMAKFDRFLQSHPYNG